MTNTNVENKNRIWLVTGAAGFLGSEICRQLNRRGERIRAFVMPRDPGVRYLPENAEVVYGDLLNKDSLEEFFTVKEGEETVCLHIASIVSVAEGYSQKVMDVNVQGTQNVIDMCLKHHECRKMVYCSSTGAIPELPKGQIIKAVDHYYPADEKTVRGCYSQSKAAATQRVLDAVHDKGLNACIIFPSGILGPGDNAVGGITKTLAQIANGEMKGGIDGAFNLCDVRDLASAAISAINHGETGRCYVLGNAPVKFKDFSKMIENETGIPGAKFFLPAWLADFIASISEWNAKRTGKKPVLTRFEIYNLTRNNVFDSTLAKVDLGYTTRPYQETIHDEVAWMKERGLIKGVEAGVKAGAAE